MKKNIITFLIILTALSGSMAFADDGAKVISDSEQKSVNTDLQEINSYTNHLFMPSARVNVIDKNSKSTDGIVKTQKLDSEKRLSRTTTPPVKKLRLMIKNKRLNKGKVEASAPVEQTSDMATLDCDYMEYFSDKTELQATGNAVMKFPQNNSTLKADKIIYNQTTNLIKAFGNVVLISSNQEMNGDFLQVDLNEENSLMDNPNSDLNQIHARAKKGYMYGDKTVAENGDFVVTKKMPIDMRADMFGPDLDRMFVKPEDKGYFMKDSHGSKIRLATNEMIINSTATHDDVLLKPAFIYANGKKILTIPHVSIHSNKKHDFVEANYPELGTMTNMGMYAGPGFVFDTPHGSTLKLVPIVNYQNDSDNPDNSKLGFGGIAKFKSGTNQTDIAYGTANKVFLMRGIQYLDDDLYLQYGANTYIDDWFLGFRMPRLMGELVYNNNYVTPNFFGKNRDLGFSQRATAAYIQDGIAGLNGVKLGEDGVGTLRLKYMAQLSQTLYRFGKQDADLFHGNFDILGQSSIGVYGTGDTQIIGRIGPAIHTQWKYWMQDVGYFVSAYDDHTPLINFDPYYYGKSNFYTRQSLRICKYLTASWLVSLNLSGDAPDGNSLQENCFFLGIGPDDIRLNIGYDTVRQQSFITMSMHLDAKGSQLAYKKMVVKNPDMLGKEKNANNTNLFDETEPVNINNVKEKDIPVDENGNIIPEHAQVINISEQNADEL